MAQLDIRIFLWPVLPLTLVHTIASAVILLLLLLSSGRFRQQGMEIIWLTRREVLPGG